MRRLFAVIVTTLLVLALAAPFAAAAAQPNLVVTGTGDMGSTWRLELNADRSIEVNFELFTDTGGQAWRIVMKDDGVVFWRGTRTTGHGGDLSIDKHVTNRAGADKIVVRAINKVTGEFCRASGTV